MKNTLLFPDILSWDTFRLSKMTVRKTGLMLGMYVVLMLGTYSIARIVMTDWQRCGSAQVLLEYPVYNARGVEIDQQYVCGTASRSCTLKGNTSRGPLYECPGLMRPK